MHVGNVTFQHLESSILIDILNENIKINIISLFKHNKQGFSSMVEESRFSINNMITLIRQDRSMK